MRMWMGSVVLLAIASAAGAETLYRWTNSDGVISYSDELKRIPEAHRAKAVRIRTGDLAGYKQYTPARSSAAAERALQLDERIARLRELNAAADAALAMRSPEGPARMPSVAVDVNRNLSLGVPSEQVADNEPIVVEEQRVRTGDVTTHIYVVRQGDRVLSIVRPHTSHSGANWPTEEELLGED
jgi:hypothetical protein